MLHTKCVRTTDSLQICFMNVSLLRKDDEVWLELVHPSEVSYLGNTEIGEYSFIQAAVSNGTFEDGMRGVSVKASFNNHL